TQHTSPPPNGVEPPEVEAAVALVQQVPLDVAPLRGEMVEIGRVLRREGADLQERLERFDLNPPGLPADHQRMILELHRGGARARVEETAGPGAEGVPERVIEQPDGKASQPGFVAHHAAREGGTK